MLSAVNPTDLDALLQKSHLWSSQFAQKPAFKRLPAAIAQEAESVILCFTEFMYTDFGLRPNQWQPQALHACLLQTFPAKVAAEAAFFEAVAPVLEPFFTFLEGQKELPLAASLRQQLAYIAAQIPDQAANPSHWGHEKLFVMAAFNDGIDVRDQDQMAQFTRFYQEQLMGSSLVH